jgi:glycosyltransferase involved in cell wall biosynthesis
MIDRICQISSVHISSDTRVFFKECRSLARAGYHTTLIARDNGEARIVDGVHIVPFRPDGGRLRRILFSPLRMLRMALKQKAALYHFHDPELIFVGMLLRLFRKKVIYDVHEDSPKVMRDKSYIRWRVIRLVISGIVRAAEKFGALFYNHIIAATPGIAVNFSSRKTTIVRNAPLLKLVRTAMTPGDLGIEKEKPVIVYVGVLSRARGLKEMVQAMEYIGPKAEMWLIGSWERSDIDRECRAEKGWQYVRFFGQKPQEEAYAYMKAGDIGIVNFHPLANHINALPNKIFEYMALGLPIVLSNFPYWRENFDRFALFVDPQNPRDIADKINRLLDDEELRLEKGKKGREFIDSGYSWESEENVLIDVYKKVLD